MGKRTIYVSLAMFLGIPMLILVTIVQASNETFDIYGDWSGSAAIQSIDESFEIYESSSNSTIIQSIYEPFGIYEDWSSPMIRSDRWIVRTGNAHEARREVLGHHLLMRYRLEGSTMSDLGFSGAMQFLLASNPSVINKMEANFQIKSYTVIGCEANQLPTGTRVRPAAISLCKFNDGTSPNPGDSTGDHFIRVMVNREAFTTDPEGMLTVAAFLFRCTDTLCINAISNVFNLDIGKIMVGEPFSLRAIWDKDNNRFLVGFNNSPDIILSYNPILNKGSARTPFADVRMQLVNANCKAGPTVTDAEIKVREILTNASAIIP